MLVDIRLLSLVRGDENGDPDELMYLVAGELLSLVRGDENVA